MSSEVEICNTGLSYLGANRIASMTEDRKEARYCNLFYDNSRDAVLRVHKWGFAQKRAALTSFTMPDDYDNKYLYAYLYPSDCLKPHNVYVDGGRTPQKHEMMRAPTGERIVLTNATNAILSYTMRVSDPTWFDAEFVEALALLVASKLAIPLLKDKDLFKQMFTMYNNAVSQAIASNARESKPKTEENVPWLDARLGVQSDSTLSGGYYHDEWTFINEDLA